MTLFVVFIVVNSEIGEFFGVGVLRYQGIFIKKKISNLGVFRFNFVKYSKKRKDKLNNIYLIILLKLNYYSEMNF